MAQEAKINFDILFNYNGLEVKVEGFNDSLFEVIETLLKKIKEITTDDMESKLKIQIEKYSKKYKNFYFDPPYSQASKYLEFLVVEPSSQPDEKLKELDRINLESLSKVVKIYLEETRFEWLIQGNLIEDEAIKIAKTSMDILQNKPLPLQKSRLFQVIKLPERTDIVMFYLQKTLKI